MNGQSRGLMSEKSKTVYHEETEVETEDEVFRDVCFYLRRSTPAVHPHLRNNARSSHSRLNV